MSNAYIRIEMDNDAFEGDNCGYELARVLREIAYKVEGTSRRDLDGLYVVPRDINGNACGTVDFEIDEADDQQEENERLNRMRGIGERYAARLGKPALLALLTAADQTVNEDCETRYLRTLLEDLFMSEFVDEEDCNEILSEGGFLV